MGFTIVEVLVALALLGLGLLFFIRFSLLAMALREEGRILAEALVFAQDEMERVLAHGWDGSGKGCLSEERTEEVTRCLKEGAVRGRLSRIVLERRRDDPLLERYSVPCLRSGEESPRRQVRLSTVRRRRL